MPLDIGALALFQKQIRGCLFGSMDPRTATPRLLGLYKDGLLDIDGMITRYPLTEINQAVHDQEEGTNVRGVVTMHS